MKETAFLIMSLVAFAIRLSGQIPNNSFEDWISFGS